MAQRKFKHEFLNLVAKEKQELFQVLTWQSEHAGWLPLEKLINDEDWQEFGQEAKPLLTTEDGVGKYPDEAVNFVITTGSMTGSFDNKMLKSSDLNRTGVKFFHSMKEADRFADYIKPKYSDKDLQETINKVRDEHGVGAVGDLLENIKKLLNSKNI